MDLNTVVCRRRGPIFTRLDDELLGLDADAGVCFSLSGSGCRIWELIASPISLDSICECLMAELDVDRERCVADVLGFVTDLDKQGLLSVGAAGDTTPEGKSR